MTEQATGGADTPRHRLPYVVPSDEGPHRKYYAATASGRDALRKGTKTWRHFADVLDGLLGTDRREAA